MQRLWTIVPLLVIVGCSEDPQPPIESTAKATPTPSQVLAYQTLKDESDLQSGFQDHVRLSVLIQGQPVNKATVTKLLDSIYNEQQARVQNDAPLWTIQIWAYKDRAYAADTSHWAAMYGGGNQQPRSLSWGYGFEEALKAPVRKYTKVSLATEQKIAYQMAVDEDAANHQGYLDHPDPQDWKAQQDESDRLTDQADAKIKRKYHLSEKDWENVIDDAERLDWPTPAAH